ncbi:hypothetical protein [Albidovulum sp.]|uniref:hypothetical protein n=1 Tax=Albidovulum sp. TaxID=1872424 RepID=UPI0039B8E832
MQAPEYINAPTARRDYFGGISAVTEWRHSRSMPDWPRIIRIGNRKFYKLSEVVSFMERHAA